MMKMEILSKYVLCTSLVILFFSCTSVQNDIFFDYTKNWRKDALGCMNLRSKEYSDSINDKFNFINKREKNLIKYLGKSDRIRSNENYRYLIYYFGTNCHNGAIIDTVDHCYLQYRINLKSNKVLDYQNICQ